MTEGAIFWTVWTVCMLIVVALLIFAPDAFA
jgi:uncharacterized integral membrane protein